MSYTYSKTARHKKWQYKDRPMTLSITDGYKLTFVTSDYFDYSLENYSLKAISKVQKQLRQSFWRFLKESKLPEFFILVVDGKEQPKRPKAFIELQVTFENNLTVDENKAICEMIVDLMSKELEIIK
jgi:hypothetical protein